VKSTLKATARKVVHRMLGPELDAQTARLAGLIGATTSSGVTDHDIVLTDFSHLLHELRTVRLRALNGSGKTLLSAGCAGLWYFEWLEACCGPLGRHIGVEKYSPKPENLPKNAEWIEASAADMPAVPDNSVDLVFSGQNIEHLTASDVVGFLEESRRVLRSDGRLVLDSPNRLVTDPLAWVHPEHTVELSPAEAREVIEAAGFEVCGLYPLWRCRDRDGNLLPLSAPSGDVRSVIDRSYGVDDPQHAFVWWIEARPREGEIDRDHLSSLVRRLFEVHWDDRVNRGRLGGGADVTTQGFPLFPGAFEVTVESGQPLELTVVDSSGKEIATGRGRVSGLIESTSFGTQVRVQGRGASNARVVVRPGPL
jgi:SAM-dependent methyltransferase